MAPHIPDFYESIVEASNRGELWSPVKISNNINPIEIEFDPSVYK